MTVLSLLLSRVDLSGLSLRMDGRAYLGAAIAIGFLTLAQGLSAQRWRVLLGENAPSWRYLWRLYAVGAFFNLFLPTAIGGDAVRAAAAVRALPRGGSIIASVVLDRGLGVLALLFYAALGLVLQPGILAPLREVWTWKVSGGRLAVLAAGVVVALALAAVLARRSERVATALGDGRRAVMAFAGEPRAVLSATGLALLVQAAYIAAWVAIALGLRLTIPFEFFLFAVPFVSLAAMLPVTLAGIGVREGAWVLLFARLGLPAANAVAYSLLYFVGFALLGLGGGVLFVLYGTTPAARDVATA